MVSVGVTKLILLHGIVGADLVGSPSQSIRWPNRNLGTGASEPGCGRAAETRTSPCPQ